MAKHNIDGNAAEDAAAAYLEDHNYKILDRNWKNKFCEIDVIAKHAGIVHFVEVKYRGSSSQGDGFDYITPAKLKQMAFAAQMWVAQNNYDGEFVLSAAQVDSNMQVDYLEEI